MTTQIRILSAASASAVAAAAIVLTAGVSTALAQEPAGRPGPGRGGPGGFGAGPLPILRQLNLTDAQRQQIKALTDEQRTQNAQAQTPMRTLGELERSLQAAIMADNPDTAQIEQLKTSIADAQAVVLAARIDMELKIAQILTPDQRKQARELADQRPGRGHPRPH
jgi:Spy/CpxP family protein refolding chaperone